jgi:hypothetical protein
MNTQWVVNRDAGTAEIEEFCGLGTTTHHCCGPTRGNRETDKEDARKKSVAHKPPSRVDIH